MKLSPEFYQQLEAITQANVSQQKNADTLNKVDWNAEAQRCLCSLITFFEKVDIDYLQANTAGVIDMRWNEYGGDIEVDFMPSNNLAIAFDDGCIMNSSAIDNDTFFTEHFNCDGAESFATIGSDYTALIRIFFNLLREVVVPLNAVPAFKKLPKKTPYYICFALFHDCTPEVIFDSSIQNSCV